MNVKEIVERLRSMKNEKGIEIARRFSVKY